MNDIWVICLLFLSPSTCVPGPEGRTGGLDTVSTADTALRGWEPFPSASVHGRPGTASLTPAKRRRVVIFFLIL